MRLQAAILVSLVSLVSPSNAAEIPPGFMDSVVALGTMEPPADGTRPATWLTTGSGFFYGVKKNTNGSATNYTTYLVTARHVVEEFSKQGKDITVRLNTSANSAAQMFPFSNAPKINDVGWFFNPDPAIDVAIHAVNLAAITDPTFVPRFFASDLHAANQTKLADLGVSAGDGVFVLGFPMSLNGATRNDVIARGGIISRLPETSEAGPNATLLIDSFVFPGNSGGPVVLRPDLVAISGTKANGNAWLIGLVVSYLPYVDTAVSSQTGRARVTFEENSGLAQVLTVDAIDNTIAAYEQRIAIPAPSP